MVRIEIPEIVSRASMGAGRLGKLHHLWYEAAKYHITQAVGDEWLKAGKEAVLQVPSAIIRSESNYLLNPGHPDFAKIRITDIQKFDVDQRLG